MKRVKDIKHFSSYFSKSKGNSQDKSIHGSSKSQIKSSQDLNENSTIKTEDNRVSSNFERFSSKIKNKK